MKKKCLLAATLICSFGLTVTGCSYDKGLVLTEQDQQLVTEYAVSALMKYNAGSNMRILSGQELLQAETAEQARLQREAKRQEVAARYENESQSKPSQNSSVSQSTVGGTENQSPSIATIEDLGSFFGLEQVSITYQNYEMVQSYGGNNGDLMAAIDAIPGKTLLVAHFQVMNQGGESRHLDMLSKKGNFLLKADGKTYQAQFTLLLNDLSLYKGDIGAGQTADTVLIFELAQEHAEAAQLELLISMDDQKGRIGIK